MKSSFKQLDCVIGNLGMRVMNPQGLVLQVQFSLHIWNTVVCSAPLTAEPEVGTWVQGVYSGDPR